MLTKQQIQDRLIELDAAMQDIALRAMRYAVASTQARQRPEREDLQVQCGAAAGHMMIPTFGSKVRHCSICNVAEDAHQQVVAINLTRG